MQSCIYKGEIFHTRQSPVQHSFRYRLFWLYLDLGEWSEVSKQVRGLSQYRFAPASFCRGDHLGDQDMPLDAAVRQFVLETAGKDLATGSIRVLTQPRSFGIYFSPLNLFYCFDQNEELAAVVGEVSNTPWGERHHYLLWSGNQVETNEPGQKRFRHAKQFHVSPFMPMDQEYDWQVNVPGDQLSAQLQTVRGGQAYFAAKMTLQRRPLTSWTLAAELCRSPISAGRVLTAIYFQALRLWMKRCPYFPHPQRSQQAAAS